MFDVSFDAAGNIVQRDGDGGDCAARTGEYYMLLAIRNWEHLENDEWPNGTGWLAKWYEASQRLLAPDGRLYRYPYAPYNDLQDVTRDQTMPMIMAATYAGDVKFVKTILGDLAHHLTFQNGKDPIGPMEEAVFIRAVHAFEKMADSYKWKLWLCDMFLCLAVVFRCLITAFDLDNVGDDINLTLHCLHATDFSPTIFSRLACWLYGRLRRKGIQYAFDWYHRPATRGNPFNILARPVIARRFYGHEWTESGTTV